MCMLKIGCYEEGFPSYSNSFGMVFRLDSIFFTLTIVNVLLGGKDLFCDIHYLDLDVQTTLAPCLFYKLDNRVLESAHTN